MSDGPYYVNQSPRTGAFYVQDSRIHDSHPGEWIGHNRQQAEWAAMICNRAHAAALSAKDAELKACRDALADGIDTIQQHSIGTDGCYTRINTVELEQWIRRANESLTQGASS